MLARFKHRFATALIVFLLLILISWTQQRDEAHAGTTHNCQVHG
jgi:hypothetical protein